MMKGCYWWRQYIWKCLFYQNGS